MDYVYAMSQIRLPLGIVASALLAGAALAQPTVPETPEPGLSAPPLPSPLPSPRPAAPEEAPAAEPASTAPPLDPAEARARHLDGLFERLAGSAPDEWQLISAQINEAWNRSGSPSTDLIARRADSAIEKQDYDTALVHLDDLTRLSPEFAEGWNKRATVYFLQEDYAASLDDIAEVIKREPRHFGALSGLGIILDRLGEKAAALEAYRRAAAVHPHLPGVQEGIKKLTKDVEGRRL